MVSGSTKRVVVIRNIPSNMIEEAILILKSDPEEKENTAKKEILRRNKEISDDHLLKEAELIINSYIKENNLCVVRDRRLEIKKDLLKNQLARGIAANLALLGSIAFLIFLITRFVF